MEAAMATKRTRKPKPADPASISAFSELEFKLAHTFVRPQFLTLALTHRSHTYEARHGAPAVVLPAHPEQRDQRNTPGSDNEQLEFLGDAIIGLVITEALFREFPDCSEGELTRLRSNLVSRKRMAAFGEELGLGDHLFLGRSAEQNGGRQKPALLANAAEAVLAAVFLDVRESGGDPLAAIRALAERYLVQPELAAMRSALSEDMGRGALRDHKTLLQERVQARIQAQAQATGQKAPPTGTSAARLRYIDTDQSGPPHQRTFVVEARLEIDTETHILASAEGPSKKEAQQRAAELALANWSALEHLLTLPPAASPSPAKTPPAKPLSAASHSPEPAQP
jgi:ribonuclease-3